MQMLNDFDLFSEFNSENIKLINYKDNKYKKWLLSFYEIDTVYHEINDSKDIYINNNEKFINAITNDGVGFYEGDFRPVGITVVKFLMILLIIFKMF